MLGEDLSTAAVTPRGMPGDRAHALQHRESGKVASAKHPRLWRDLLGFTAAYLDPGVRITLPDGKMVHSTDADVDEVLSARLGLPVSLIDTLPPEAELDRAVPEQVLASGVQAEVPVESLRFGRQSPPGTFFDFAPVHLISTSTLERIGAESPRGLIELERYRPNLVISTPAPGFVENGWAGGDLHVGDELVLRIVAQTPRCAVPTLAHGDLPPDPAALRVPAAHNRVPPMESLDPRPCAGAYAQVVRPGTVRVGDPVRRVPVP